MKVLRVITALLLAVSVGLTAFIGRAKIAEGITVKEQAHYKGIITVWHLDTFEGGTGSRKQFLLSAARSFERANQGVLVMVVNHTPTSLKENLEKGIYPDLVSFGCGVDVKGIIPIMANRKVKGGYIGEKFYAAAWCRGGYTIIANPKLTDKIPDELDTLIISEGEFTEPAVALIKDRISVKEFEVLAPMDAYIKFVGGKEKYLLGTQRDIKRLENRGIEVITRPIENFCDLYQYIGLIDNGSAKKYYAERFLNYLLSDAVQKRLTEIGMFSPYINNSFDNEHLSTMQKVKPKFSLSAFISAHNLKEMQELSLDALKGNKDAKNKIENILV